MAEEKSKRRWVWWSDADSVDDQTTSVLALGETVLASALGLWVWMYWGLYPLLLSSLVMAFLTMLRSKASVELGSELFQNFLSDKTELSLFSWRGAGIVTLSALITGGVMYYLALNWLPPYSGWSLFWRASLLGLLSMNIGIALSLAIARTGEGAAWAAAFAVIPASQAGAGAGAGAVSLVVAIAIVLVLHFVPGMATGFLIRAILTRAYATLRHFNQGLLLFPTNWSSLVSSIDLMTEPEIVPGLPDGHEMLFNSEVQGFKGGHFPDKPFVGIVILILFVPTWLFRLTLKSTFLIYWPLLFVSAAPNAQKTKTGELIWDHTLGRSIKDWLAVLIACIVVLAIGYSIYDHSVFASFVAWADPRGLPSHDVLRALSFKVWELDLWEWSALTASAITVIVFLWANAINLRYSGKEQQPGWVTLKTVYFLNRFKMLCVLATVLASVFAWVWFVHDTCTMPDWITQILTYVLGSPGACIQIP